MTVDVQTELRQGRRRRLLIENLTAYAFLFPAGLIIFLFGIFPVLFALFVSIHRWRRFPDQYVGLGNYVQALGDFTYVVFFWLAIAAVAGGLYLAWRTLRPKAASSEQSPENAGFQPWSPLQIVYLIFGALNAGAILLFIRWMGVLLPQVLNVPRRLLGQGQSQGLFVNEFFASFRVPEIADAGNLMLVAVIAAVILSLVVSRWINRRRPSESIEAGANTLLFQATSAVLLVTISVLVFQLVAETIDAAVQSARASGTELPIWSQVILISAGAGLLGAAYWLWRRSVGVHSNRGLIFGALAAVALMIGGYVLVAEVPRLLASADSDMLSGFSVTIMYSALAVPLQLALGLGLAVLLFQNLKGKAFFRMVFFMPYIMPFVATSVVFTLLFSHRQDSIINHLIGLVGIAPQKWLSEPNGIGNLILGPNIPGWLSGPSLALLVVIFYAVWTYAGYATVVFLAGLVNISGELSEAARIDGASGWAIFRHITLPLLSPTTFFLMLIAIIGTFQAFTQLWIMRSPATGKSIDTVSVFIFRQLTDSPNYGYASAVAFVLFGVILTLTIIQNRFAGRRVFYG
jgi:multiple sugar transport system permease protein